MSYGYSRPSLIDTQTLSQIRTGLRQNAYQFGSGGYTSPYYSNYEQPQYGGVSFFGNTPFSISNFLWNLFFSWSLNKVIIIILIGVGIVLYHRYHNKQKRNDGFNQNDQMKALWATVLSKQSQPSSNSNYIGQSPSDFNNYPVNTYQNNYINDGIGSYHASGNYNSNYNSNSNQNNTMNHGNLINNNVYTNPSHPGHQSRQYNYQPQPPMRPHLNDKSHTGSLQTNSLDRHLSTYYPDQDFSNDSNYGITNYNDYQVMNRPNTFLATRFPDFYDDTVIYDNLDKFLQVY